MASGSLCALRLTIALCAIVVAGACRIRGVPGVLAHAHVHRMGGGEHAAEPGSGFFSECRVLWAEGEASPGPGQAGPGGLVSACACLLCAAAGIPAYVATLFQPRVCTCRRTHDHRLPSAVPRRREPRDDCSAGGGSCSRGQGRTELHQGPCRVQELHEGGQA